MRKKTACLSAISAIVNELRPPVDYRKEDREVGEKSDTDNAVRSCFLFHGLQAKEIEKNLVSEQNISRSLAVLVTSRSDINDPSETRAAPLSSTGSIPHSLCCNSLTTDNQSDRKRLAYELPVKWTAGTKTT